MDHQERLTIELRLGPFTPADLVVRRAVGVEALSAPYAFEVDVLPVDPAPLELAPLLGAEACLSLARPGQGTRWVHGLCVRAEHTGVEAAHPTYRFTLAPRFALLGRRRNSRVFQGKSVPEIVKEVLDQAGVAHRSAISGAYPSRELCLQYEESDRDFVSRLLEEEGIAYWFEHSEGGHVLVLGDASSAFGALPEGDELPYRPAPDAANDVDHVAMLRRARRVRPAAAMVRDYDFERPRLDLGARADAGEPGAAHDEYPGRYTAPAQGQRLSRTRLEELRVEDETWSGTSNCHRLVPGAAFQVTEHPAPGFGERLVVARVEHDASQQTSLGDVAAIEDRYRNRFLALCAALPFRPARRTPRPRVKGPQTATVVGPAGEEIHLDRYGRVRIQFHWDRQGQRDERSSAWVRLAQPWAGAGFGAVFVPRIGQEVVVRFLEGDPDRPLVMGAVYNGENPVPAELPGERTQSTLRTSSSPAYAGENELRFEDARGQEQILVHAQKDAQLETRNDERQEVHGAETLHVGRDRSQTIAGNQRLQVNREDASRVGGNRTLTVGGRRATSVAGAHAESVGGVQSVAVRGFRLADVVLASAETVGLASAVTVGGAYAVSVGGVARTAVGGAAAVEVGGARFELIGAEHRERVGGSRSAETGGAHEAEVKGSARLWTQRDQTETVSGKTNVEVAGNITLHARTIDWVADKLTVNVGGQLAFVLGGAPGAVTVAGPTVSLKAPAKLKAPSVSKPGAAPPEKQAIQKVQPPDSIEDWTVECGHHASKGERAIIKRGSRIEIVPFDGEAKRSQPDRITLRYRKENKGQDEAPGSLQLVRCDPGAPAAAPKSVAGKKVGSYHDYAFDAEYLGDLPYFFFLPSFWKAYRSKTSYRLTGTSSPLLVDAYCPHQYKLEISVPPFKTYKSGKKWEKATSGTAADGTKLSWRHPGETEKKPEKEVKTHWESSRLALKGDKLDKPSGPRVPVKAFAYTVDGLPVELDALKLINTFIKFTRELVSIAEKFKENAPKIGWYLNVEAQFLQGGAAVEWYWKEPHELKGDPRGKRPPDQLSHDVYQYIDVKVALTLFSVSIEGGIGVSAVGCKAQIFLKGTAKLDLAFDGCRDSPDAPPGFKVPLTLSVPFELGARIEAGDAAKVEGKGESGFELAFEVGVNQPRRLGMVTVDFTAKWTGLKVTFVATVGFFGIQGSYTREWKLIDEHEFKKFQWPAEPDPPPAPISRDRIHAVVVDVLSKGLDIRVIKPAAEWWKADHHWTTEEIAAKVTDRILREVKADPHVVCTSKSMEGLTHAIRQDLDHMGARAVRNWVAEPDFLAYVNGPKLAKYVAEMRVEVATASQGSKA